MPASSYAEVTPTAEGDKLLTSARLWEHRVAVVEDDLSPDLIADLVRRSNDTLIDQCFQRMVALDWSTWRSHIHHDTTFDERYLVIRVDTL